MYGGGRRRTEKAIEIRNKLEKGEGRWRKHDKAGVEKKEETGDGWAWGTPGSLIIMGDRLFRG